MKQYLVFSSILCLLCSCASVNYDPNILAQPEYKAVQYISELSPEHKKLGTVVITNSGVKANILNTIPDLFMKAKKKHLKESSDLKIFLSELKFRTYSKKEMVRVSYQDCRNVPKQVYVPSYGANGSSGSYQTQYVQECATKYRNEERIVPYQKAGANIYRKI